MVMGTIGCSRKSSMHFIVNKLLKLFTMVIVFQFGVFGNEQ